MTPQTEILLLAVLVSVSCALPGTFLVLRQMSLMSDAISHSVLLGIVIGFFITGRIDSPVLLILAAATGILTVSLVELLHQTQLVKEDAAIGVVFPALFSLGVILVTRYAGSVHIDQDVVLLGEIALSPFDRIVFFGWNLPRALVTMSFILVIALLSMFVFYKELKISTFDVGLATSLGFSPILINYGLMSLVSVTAVGAFDAVGAILVIALMIVPPATAYLLTDRLSTMLILSSLTGAVSAVCGYGVAIKLDASIAGAMATLTGFTFLLAFLFAPKRGMIAIFFRRLQQKLFFAQNMLLIYLNNHNISNDSTEDNYQMVPYDLDQVHHHLHWDESFTEKVIFYAEQNGCVERNNGILYLTDFGQNTIDQFLIELT